MTEEKANAKEAQKPAPIATIKLDDWENHPERHGAMFDLAASEDVEFEKGETKIIPLGVRMKLPDGYFGFMVPRSSTCLKHGILMANSVGIIEPDYCGNNDVWGFVAYAVRDTRIPKGTRIAQFMPMPMFGDLDFDVVDSMPYTDRGGYGSTGEKSAEGQTAEGRTHRDANGLELHVGDYVIDEFGECFCVMGLNEEDGATAAYADLGNSRTSLECAPCLSLRLDERPHDCDGVPIEVGDVLYQTTFEGKPIGDPMEVKRYTGNALFVKGLALPINAWTCTHREPDSFELIARESEMDACQKDGAEMISDEERREVARKLRELTKKPMGKSMQRMFTETLGIYAHHISWMNPDKATNRWDVIVNYLADLIEPQHIDGNTSDGYHTFNELYHHRAVLFSVIVENFATRAWKSKLHADGTMYEGMFIVGIETPDGQATYHYDVEPYWHLFRCKEVDRAPEWDGHTPGQAIERIGKLVDLIDRPTCRDVNEHYDMFECSECHCKVEMIKEYKSEYCSIFSVPLIPSYCPNCGAEVVE